MDKVINYITINHLKLIIILILMFLAYQQKRILSEAETCQCWSMLDDIQADVNDIKNSLD